MAVFSKPEDYNSLAAYTPHLVKAVKEIKPDESVNFLYFNQFEYDAARHHPATHPLVLIAYAPTFASGVPIPQKPTQKWNAKGVAQLTADGKIRFEIDAGRMLFAPLQKFFTTLSKALPEIDLTAPEIAPPPDRPAPPQPITHPPVTLSLPVDPNQHLDFVMAYIANLENATLPVDADTKEKALKAANLHFKNREFVPCMSVLNDLVKGVTFRGVPDWVVDQASRRHRVEELTEQYTAMIALIQQKRKEKSEGATDEHSLTQLKAKMSEAGLGMGQGVLTFNPAVVKTHYDNWHILEKAKDLYQGKLKKYWLEDQTKRLEHELKGLGHGAAGSDLYAMLEQFGKDQTLELAQMAQIQAELYRKKQPKPDAVKHEEVLNVAELASIFSYSTANYNTVNKMLRNNPQNQADRDEIEEAKQKFAAYIKSAQSGLAKLPVYVGSAYRSNKSFWPEFITEITTTGHFTEPSFMSAAKKKTSGFGSLDLVINPNETGRDISMFSMHQTEGEILFPPGGRFKFSFAQIVAPDGSTVQIRKFTDFATHVTTATRVGQFIFEQVS